MNWFSYLGFIYGVYGAYRVSCRVLDGLGVLSLGFGEVPVGFEEKFRSFRKLGVP